MSKIREQNDKGLVVEAQKAITFHCPHCCRLNFTHYALEDLGKTHNDCRVKSDTVDCIQCKKEVNVVEFI
jgi:phage FluMu protein Com